MKKHIVNLIFYFICFSIQAITIYRLAFTIPPKPGTPDYREYLFGTIAISVVIGLMIVVPNLIIEYFIGNWKSKT